MQILFATYRTYTNTQTLIETILTHYQTIYPASLDITEDIRQTMLTNLSSALIFLLNTYKEDFYEPPIYSTLNYLMKSTTDRDVLNQCRSLYKRFVNEGENTLKIECSNSFSLTLSLHSLELFQVFPKWIIITIPSIFLSTHRNMIHR